MDSVRLNFRKRILNVFFDVIALKYISENGSLAGYDFMMWIHKRYGVMLSSGTVYTKIHSLDRKELIRGEWGERKKVYALTKKGEAFLKSILTDPTSEQFLKLLEKPL